MESIFKYPRTPHLRGSRLGPGDASMREISFEEIVGKPLVVEEKLDGANCGISFDKEGQLRLQSRGHYLLGGPRETQFDLFKRWAYEHQQMLWQTLSDRYLMFGEWLYAKHTIFYDCLPEYFVEFDIYDSFESVFLDTTRRQELLQLKGLSSAPVLSIARIRRQRELLEFLGPSRFISDQARERYEVQVHRSSHDPQLAISETDLTGQMEGLYVKVEEQGVVTHRMKYVRDDFRAIVDRSGSHWLDRPIVRNLLAES